jgi:hypothetical protein
MNTFLVSDMSGFRRRIFVESSGSCVHRIYLDRLPRNQPGESRQRHHQLSPAHFETGPGFFHYRSFDGPGFG